SMCLNVTLPDGIVGDVHRGVSHGRDVCNVGRALRAVGWERFAGQVAQFVLTVIVLLVLPSPVQSAMPFVAIAVVVGVSCMVVARGWYRMGVRRGWPRGEPRGDHCRGLRRPGARRDAARCRRSRGFMGPSHPIFGKERTADRGERRTCLIVRTPC